MTTRKNTAKMASTLFVTSPISYELVRNEFEFT